MSRIWFLFGLHNNQLIDT